MVNTKHDITSLVHIINMTLQYTAYTCYEYHTKIVSEKYEPLGVSAI